MPSGAEFWPPYFWLWNTIVLSRDANGEPRPYTFGFRANAKMWLPIFAVVVIGLLCWWAQRIRKLPWWALALLLFAVALAAHIWW